MCIVTYRVQKGIQQKGQGGMRDSLIIVGFFVVGLLLGLFWDALLPLVDGGLSMYVLSALMFCVGLSIGLDKDALRSLRGQDKRVILLPICTVLGALLGPLVVYPLISSTPLTDVWAVASGFGYYSLSSILLSEYRGVELGTMALMANIVREIFSLLAAPLLVRWFSPLGLISSAGATSMDTLLPVISTFSGRDYVILAIFHGLVLELTVPLLVTFFASL